jgi:hypothetical protein
VISVKINNPVYKMESGNIESGADPEERVRVIINQKSVGDHRANPRTVATRLFTG